MTYKKLLFAFLLLIALSGVIAGISLYYQPEQSTLGLLIIIGAALLGSATFIGGLNDTYDLLGKLFTRNHPESKETSPKEIYQVSSKNQAGGITVGHVGTININDTQATGSNTNTNQLQKDEQTALLYQTEISVFLHKFKTCLHWTLPLGKNTDKEIDGAFNYGVNFAKAIDLDKISKDIIIRVLC